MRQRVVVAHQAHRVRIGLLLALLLGRIIVVSVGIVVGIIGVAGGDLGRCKLRGVGGPLLAALPGAVADHRGAGTAAFAFAPAAIIATSTTTASRHIAAGIFYVLLAS